MTTLTKAMRELAMAASFAALGLRAALSRYGLSDWMLGLRAALSRYGLSDWMLARDSKPLLGRRSSGHNKQRRKDPRSARRKAARKARAR